jgi:hypothetical protein
MFSDDETWLRGALHLRACNGLAYLLCSRSPFPAASRAAAQLKVDHAAQDQDDIA